MSHLRLGLVAALLLPACDNLGTDPDVESGADRPLQAPISVVGINPLEASLSSECPNRCVFPLSYSSSSSGAQSSVNEVANIATSGGIVWSKSGQRNLPPLVGGGTAKGADINDYGQVAGHTLTPSGPRATVWEPDGQALEVGTLGGSSSEAKAINDLPQVVGSSTNASGKTHAFIWTWRDGISALSGMPAAAEWSFATDINDRSQVVGGVVLAGNGHAFVWTAASGAVLLPEPAGAGFSEAFSINDDGWIAGRVGLGPEIHAALWKPSGSGYTFVDLGALPGHARAEAMGINHWGEVVGLSYQKIHGMDGPVLGWVWRQDTGMVLLPGEAGSAYSINSWGDIVGHTRSGAPVVWTWSGNESRYR